MSRSRKLFAALPFAAALVLVAAAAGKPAAKPPASLVAKIPSPFAKGAAQAPGTYVGSTASGRSAPYVALVVEGAQAVVYVCDGKFFDWFGASAAGGKLQGSSAKGTSLAATLGGGSVRGAITLASGKKLSFTAAPPARHYGLFRDEKWSHTGVLLGWIVLPTGTRGTVSDGGTLKTGVATTTTSTGTSTAPTSTTSSGGSATGTKGTGCTDAFPGGCGWSCGDLAALETELVSELKATSSKTTKLILDKKFATVDLQSTINGC